MVIISIIAGMSANIIYWEKVSFNEYFDNDGTLVKTVGFTLNGEVLLFHNLPFTKSNERVATVAINTGELYFIPFPALTFLHELN